MYEEEASNIILPHTASFKYTAIVIEMFSKLVYKWVWEYSLVCFLFCFVL